MKASRNFFKDFNNFLNNAVKYLDTRIVTGKFIEDLIYLFKYFITSLVEKNKELIKAMKQSEVYILFADIFTSIWRLLLKIPLFAVVVSLIATLLKILITCYSDIFIIFSITFTSSILLLNWFQTTIETFFIAFLPIFLLDILCVSALFYCIDKKQSGEKVSIWQCFPIIIRHFTFFSFPVITESSIIIESVVAFFAIAILLQYPFTFFNISWSGSIVYWFITLTTGIILLLGNFYISIFMPQTYFAVLLDDLPFQKAIKEGRKAVQSYLWYYIVFYLLLYIFCIFFLWKSILSFLYIGATIGIYCTIAAGIVLGYLLRKKFQIKNLNEKYQMSNQKIHIGFIVVIVFGFINYFLVMFLLMKEYQPILSFMQEQQNNYLASQEEKLYTNIDYHYSLEYPQNWTLYQWNKNSVTFYNNYTGTLSGGTWMTITVSSYDEAVLNEFTTLYNAEPGVVIIDPVTKNITTKITNMTIEGYNGVTYSYIKNASPYMQYETHYLIHKNNTFYDISFISITNDVALYNSTLFQKIINSFMFTN